MYELRRALADGTDGEMVLSAAFGSTFGQPMIEGMRRASLRRVKKDPSALPPPGRKRARAQPDLSRSWKKRTDDPSVTRQVLALLMIAGWMQPGEKRTGTSEQQEYRLSAGELGRRIGVHEREITRYHAVWEATGLISVWQPPQISGNATGPSGHCYSVYELKRMPPELQAHLDAWHGVARARERAEQQQKAVAPAAPSSAPIAPVPFDAEAADAALAYAKARAGPR